MPHEPARPRRWSRFVAAGLAGVGVVCLIVLGLHAPPVRALALRYLMRAALTAGVRVEAARLDYNVATLRVGLNEVRVLAVGQDEPFFTAAQVAARLSPEIFSGYVRFDEVTIERGSVHITRAADGRLNLPRGASSSEAEPEALPIGRLLASRLSLAYLDRANQVALRAADVTLDLSPRGRIQIAQPIEVSFGSVETRLTELAGGLAFNGRDLTLSDLRVESPEASAGVQGTLGLVRRQPTADLRVTIDGDLARVSRLWGQSDAAPRGSFHADGVVRGALDAPVADLRVSSTRVTWNGLDVDALSARARVDERGVLVDEGRLMIGGGAATVSGRLEWASSTASADAQWRDVDLARLASVWVQGRPLPSGEASGQLSAEGSLEQGGAWNARAHVAVAAAAPRDGRIAVPGDLDLRLSGHRWTVDSRVDVGGSLPVSASLTGELSSTGPFDSTLSGRIVVGETPLDAIARVLVESGVVPPVEDLPSGSIRGSATVAGTFDRPVLTADLSSDAMNIAGQTLADVRAHATLRGTTLAVDELTARQPTAPGDSRPHGPIRLEGTYDLTSDRYTARLSTGLLWIEPSAGLPVTGPFSVEYAGEGHGRVANGTGRVTATLTAGPRFDLGEMSSTIVVSGEVAHVTASLPLFGATATADLSLVPPYSTTARVDAMGVDLGRTANQLGLLTSVEGSADLHLDAEGPLERWRDGRASLEVTRLTSLFESVPSRRVPFELHRQARARYEAGRVWIDGLDASLGGTVLSASGSLAAFAPPSTAAADEGPPLVATLTGDVSDVALLTAFVDDVRRSTTPLLAGGRGPVTLLARVGGSIASPSIEADLEVGPAEVVPSVQLAPIENVRIRAHLAGEAVELRELDAVYQGMRVSAAGQAPLGVLTGSSSDPPGEARLTATLSGITSSVLSRIVDEATLEQILGSADARIDLRSPSTRLEDVRGEVALDRLELSVANLPVTQRQPTRLVASDGLVRIASWEWETEGSSLGVQGQVNLRDGQAAVLASGLLDARLVAPFLRNPNIATAGQLETHLSLTGPFDRPTINGDLRLASGELRVREPQLIAQQVDAHAVLARGRVNLVSLGGLVNGGTMTGSGTFQYAPAPEGRLSVSIDGMALNVPAGLRTEVTSSLELQATAKGQAWDGRLSGLVTITRGSYREPMALVTGLLANLRSTTTTGTRARSVLDRIALDVRVVTDEDLVVANNVAQAEIGADLRVINVASAPSLSGRAELREGGRLFLGRNTYTIRTGTVDFANPTVIEPILGIDAATRVSGVDVEVRLSGPPDALMSELTSSSDPELGRADLTALLLTGHKVDELSEAQAATVGAQLFGNLAGDVLGVAGQAVGLDTLRVGGVDTTIIRDPADVAAEADPTSRLTFGKSIGSKLDVTLSQSLRDGGAQTWIVDYTPIRRIALRFVSDDEELRSYQFRHDLVFGGPPRAITSGDVSRRLEPGRVTAIRITGRTGVPEPELRAVLSLRVGDRFDFLSWQQDRDRLAQFYHHRHHLAATIDSTRMDTAKGVEIAYAVDEGPETRVRASGAELKASTIEAIETAWASSVFEGFFTDEATGIVRRALAAEGFYEPVVRSVITNDARLRTLDITITPGPRIDRVDVRLTGVADPLKADLLAHMRRRLGSSGGFDARLYEEALRDGLQGQGYVRGRATAGAPSAEGSVLVIPVEIDSGPQFQIARTTVEGASAIATDDLLKTAGLQAGEVYRPEVVEDARAGIEGLLRREGYPMATVETRPDTDESAATIALTFLTDAGPRQVVGDVTVSGNRTIDADVVARALRLQVGDPLKPGDWLEARHRLFETGLFRRVDISSEAMDTSGSTVPVRLVVVVEEWPALRIRYGLQVSEAFREDDVTGRELVPGLSGDVTRRTLFGRAITLGGAAQYQRREQLGRLFVSTPSLFGLPVRSAFALERVHEVQRALTLSVDRTTASWEQRAEWRALRLFYGLRFERNHTFDTEASNDPNFPAFDLTVAIGRFNTGFSWDTRDDPANAVRGSFMSGDVEWASRALGSDLFFVKSLNQYYRFQSVKGVVLASAARLGLAWPLGDQTVVPSQRFFAGGARTVRGVGEDALGGVDFLGIPIGGEGLLLFNQEVRFPIFRWFRGVAFVDAGNAFPRPRDIRVNNLVVSTGVGLRLMTPFVLLRVDYGRTVVNRPVPDSGLWTFGIGHAF